MPTISIKQWPVSIDAGNNTLLASALGAGVPFPHQCRTGECGSCRCKLIRGRVKQDSFLPEALDQNQQDNGWVLACRSQALEDVELDCPGEWASVTPAPSRWKANVGSVNQVAERIIHLRLRSLSGPFAFIAGQYFDLSFKGLPTRSYSPANAPGSDLLDFYITVHDAGRVSGFIASDAKPGETLILNGPYGSAHLQTGHDDKPILGVAIGTGLAPLLSIARSYNATNPAREMHLLAQARNPESAFASAALRTITDTTSGFSFRQIYRSDNQQNAKHSLSEVLLDTLPAPDELQGWQIHIAGSPQAVDHARDLLIANGADRTTIHIDSFTPGTRQKAGGFALFRQIGSSVSQLFRGNAPEP